MTRLWDRIRDWVFLFTFLGTSIVLMVAQNEPLVRGLRSGAMEATSWLEARFAWVGGYFRALDENEILREENIVLSSEVARSREAVLENERLRRLMGLADTTSYEMRAARIIGKDITGQQNLLTLNVGLKDSVREGMAVVDERGILGKIILVSENYSRVMPYLNTGFHIPAKVQPLQASGIVRWEGDRSDRLLLAHIVKTEKVEPGQLVVTSGYSGIFPPGYPVGVVDSVSSRTGRNELVVYLRPASPISAAEYAFVLLTRPDPERLELEGAGIR